MRSALQDVTVDYAFQNGTAINGLDFTGVSGSLRFAGTLRGSAVVKQTVSFDIQGDTTPESDETLFLTLSNVSSNSQITQGQGTGIILNDDPRRQLSWRRRR
jgi:Calx-beta domain-containing protein